MKIHKSQTGFTPLHIVLILFLVGIIGFTGWRVYDANKATKASLDNAANNDLSLAKKNEAKPAESKVSNGFVEYQNKELGLKFAYPKDWGEINITDYVNKKCAEQIKTSPSKVTGNVYDLNFSKNSDKTIRLITNDFNVDMQVKCLIIGPYYGNNESQSFLKIGSIDYRVVNNDYECGLSTYYLVGLAPLNTSKFKNAEVMLHSLRDPNAGNYEGSENCFPRDEFVKKTQNLLTEEDKQVMNTFKAL